MIADQDCVAKVETLLGRLKAFCDTGFALAIHIRYTRPSLLCRTYAADWIETYSAKGYMLSDPVVHWGLTHTGWVDWADLTGQDPAGVLADAAAHGLRNGLTYACGPASSRTITGFTRSTGPFTESERAELQAITEDLHAATEGIEQFDEETLAALRALSG